MYHISEVMGVFVCIETIIDAATATTTTSTTTITVVKRPIYKLCRKTIQSVGTPTRTKFWSKQDLFYWIELEKDDCPEAWMIQNAGV